MPPETSPTPGHGTIAEHMADCKAVSDVVKNANALLVIAGDQLKMARRAFEELAKVQHPMVCIMTGVTAAEYCTRQVSAINELLGDRPKLG